MKYTIKSHPTRYAGILFRSRLEARYAAFFDICRWTWEYEPFDLFGWSPDFRVSFPCGHSECSGCHILMVEVKPYTSIDEFAGHPSLDYPYGKSSRGQIPADASASFGYNPSISTWEMAHGCGGGVFNIEWEISDWKEKWDKAGEVTQYKPVNA